MDAILQELPNTILHLDILVVRASAEAHLNNLTRVLKRLQQHGLRVSHPNVQELVDYKIDLRGVHTTISKVDAIQKTPIPHNVQQLRLFLGLLHYYGKFIPNLSLLLHPFTVFLKQNSIQKYSGLCMCSYIVCYPFLYVFLLVTSFVVT